MTEAWKDRIFTNAPPLRLPPEPASFFKRMVDEHLERCNRLRDAELRRMLAAWVSELEPCLAFRHDHRIAGLTVADHCNPDGTTPLYVLSSYVDPQDPWGQREAEMGPPIYLSPRDLSEPAEEIILDLRP
ncbi:hypothetical protein ACUXK4_004485 [Methylorubrum extorquens]